MPRKILIVDDNIINRQLLEKILQDDYEILQAEDGKVAMDILKKEHSTVSAVLLDIVMPVMDGYEVLQAMRADDNYIQIPVIIMTSNSESECELKAFSLGANDFAVKPYNPELLKSRLRNIINLKESAAMINALKTDALTGLYNRTEFFEQAENMILTQPAGYYVMSAFDINNFKVINDRYGNETGDEVLRHLARTFRDGFSKVGGVCGRITADNFAVLYPLSFMSTDELKQIRKVASEPKILPAPITIAIGRLVVDDLGLSLSAMYDRASIAKQSVKGNYDNFIGIYDESMRNRLLREQEIVSEMEEALRAREFEIWFQPQYNHSSGALIGAEALVRWRHPKRGLIAPYEFIPLFERNGFIYELDKYVWEESCRHIREWLDKGQFSLPISVNVSRYDVFREDLVQIITGLVKKYDVPAELLHIEITESAFAKSTEQIINVVKALIAEGFIVEIDDFGSGYSSLNTLKDVPAHVVKLDMRFLEGDRNSSRGGNIVESIVRMIKWLNMSVIAEGVETEEQANFLKSVGCVYVQGYLYAKPMPLDEYVKLANRVVTEHKKLTIDMVQHLDNNNFWDPKSIDTLIFSSYVGGASIFECNKGRIELLRANDKFVQTIGVEGLTTESVMALDWENHLSKDNLASVNEAIHKSIETQSDVTEELVFLSLPGCPKKTYLKCSLRVIANTGDRYLVYCIVENITAQRQAEQKERDAAKRLSLIMNNIGSGVMAAMLEEDGNVKLIYANSRYYQCLGYTKAEFKEENNDPIEGTVVAEDLEAVRAFVKNVSETRETSVLEYRVTHKTGKVIWVRMILSVTQSEELDMPLYIGVFRDITEEKLYELKLLEADKQLSFLNEVAHDLLAEMDVDKGFHGALKKIMEYFDGKRAYIFELDYETKTTDNTYEVCADGVESEKEMLQDIPFDLVPYWLQIFNDGVESINITSVDDLDETRSAEKQLLIAQGIQSLVAVPIRKRDKLLGFVGIDDPTRRHSLVSSLSALGDYLAVMLGRRDLFAKIRDDNKTLISLMNDTPGGFARYKVSSNGGLRTMYVNSGYCNILGITYQDVMDPSKMPLDRVHPDDISKVSTMINEMCETGESRKSKYRLRGGNGEYVTVSVFGRISRNESDEAFINSYYTIAD